MKWFRKRIGLSIIELGLFCVIMIAVTVTDMKSDWRSLTMFMVTLACGYVWGMSKCLFEEMKKNGEI